MPSGHASYKGKDSKPNVNAPGIVGEASDPSAQPEELLSETLTNNAAHRAEEESVDYPPAVERPQHSKAIPPVKE